MDSISCTSSLAPAALDDPLYYLRNFRAVLEWVAAWHGDLLNDQEQHFVPAFLALPVASQGLLARLMMRKGELFRADKLGYPELGLIGPAAAPLIELGWLDPAPELSLEALFGLFTKAELGRLLSRPLAEAGQGRAGRKADWLAALAPLFPQPLPPGDWRLEEPLLALKQQPLCDRFRLMFFGNLHQSWSEFVLAELGTFRYQPVAFDAASRPFWRRQHLDLWLEVQACREDFEAGEPLEEVQARLSAQPSDCPWVEQRRQRLRFKIARQWERLGDLPRADALYQNCQYPGARARRLRVLERMGACQSALELAGQAIAAPESETERQQLDRLLPRLQRRLGLPCASAKTTPAIDTLTVHLPTSGFVEGAVSEYLAAPRAPVFYVENTLITGLFGLLCWEALFAPVPGAFFHPFQSAPADLYHPGFHARRRAWFDPAFQALESGAHGPRILDAFNQHHGTLSPLVHWGVLDEALLALALECIPAAHLRLCFQRLLRDLKANRAGLPDLIQFWPAEKRYRMIEVKGPGDRLQDNQRRWLAFFAEHRLPAAVCQVQWTAP